MAPPHRIALLGFSDFERGALSSFFRLAAQRQPRYELATHLDEAEFVIADADHAPSVQLVLATDALPRTVFIGHHSPAGAGAWMARPIDPLHVVRELDALVLLAAASPPAPIRPPAAMPAPAPAKPPFVERRRVPRSGGLVEAPRKPPRSRAAAKAEAPAPAPAAVPRALVVDDSDVALRFLESKLQRWGVAVDRARDSSQAAARLARRDYDFVFVDVELGPDSELDGLALVQHFKRHHPLAAAVTVMVSAHHSEMDRVRGTLAGCDAYLGKPLVDAELERLLLRQGLKPPPAPPAPQVPPTTPEAGAAQGGH